MKIRKITSKNNGIFEITYECKNCRTKIVNMVDRHLINKILITIECEKCAPVFLDSIVNIK